MTDAPVINTVEELDEDPRLELEGRVAVSLAELSAATDAPNGFSPVAEFNPEDVNFRSPSWIDRLLEVQGWLRFDQDLPDSDAETVVKSLAVALGFNPVSEGFEAESPATPSIAALERLAERAELASQLQQAYAAVLSAEAGSALDAATNWEEWWSDKEDTSNDEPLEPITAKADVWPIAELTDKSLNLTPSYQRGDVWSTGDRQLLIESILRGIPLPSIILLKTGPKTPHDVVDGKQRLTTLLRFVGKHPIAKKHVAAAAKLHPEVGFEELFKTDYPKFRAAWKAHMGEILSQRLEDEYYFPFKLRTNKKGGLVGAELEKVQGKYFSQIGDLVINVADEEVTVSQLFGSTISYKVPVIEYTKANPRQIHEVFKLYNKQGVHLNAEEIRNAMYHDVELTRAILVAAGDVNLQSNIDEIAPSLAGVSGIKNLGQSLTDYGFGTARYRRTKVLGWIVATLITDSGGKQLKSTAAHTSQLLEQIQEDECHPLRERKLIADLIGLLAHAVELHSAHDELWPPEFRGKGDNGKWQDLQLVGSILGVAIALAYNPDGLEEKLYEHASEISHAAKNSWKRPAKTQTRTQWDYIARIVEGIAEILGIDLSDASEKIRVRFGSSGIESLLGTKLRTGE